MFILLHLYILGWLRNQTYDPCVHGITCKDTAMKKAVTKSFKCLCQSN